MKKVINKIRSMSIGSTLALLFLTVIWSIPTVGLLSTSLRRRDQAEVSPWWDAIFNPLNQAWSIDAYSNSLANGGMLESLVNTLVVTIPSVILPLLVAANAAFAFTFIQFKGREIYFAIIIGLMIIPLQSALIPVLRGMVAFQRATGLHLTGNFASAWIIHCAFALPLAIYIL